MSLVALRKFGRDVDPLQQSQIVLDWIKQEVPAANIDFEPVGLFCVVVAADSVGCTSVMQFSVIVGSGLRFGSPSCVNSITSDSLRLSCDANGIGFGSTVN